MLKIVSAPDNVLSQKAKLVKNIDKSILSLIEEMKKTLNATHDPEGVGLAAPQVGRNLQIFITKPTRKSRIQVFINPKLSPSPRPSPARGEGVISSPSTGEDKGEGEHHRAKKQKSIKLEGCLSLPNIWGEVERTHEVEISYLDEKGKEYTKLFKGFPATIIQHEFDHLQGTLFPKRVLEQKGQLYKSKRNEKGEDVFEEIEL